MGRQVRAHIGTQIGTQIRKQPWVRQLVIDTGRAAARFVSRLRELLETGDGVPPAAEPAPATPSSSPSTSTATSTATATSSRRPA